MTNCDSVAMSGRRFNIEPSSFFFLKWQMSRLIVKHLPSYVTPAKLRDHFEQKKGPGGTLTDVKVSSKPDGTSRCFGFVGYKTDHEALAAQRWFNRTFIDSTRISVEVIEVTNFYWTFFPDYS